MSQTSKSSIRDRFWAERTEQTLAPIPLPRMCDLNKCVNILLILNKALRAQISEVSKINRRKQTQEKHWIQELLHTSRRLRQLSKAPGTCHFSGIHTSQRGCTKCNLVEKENSSLKLKQERCAVPSPVPFRLQESTQHTRALTVATGEDRHQKRRQLLNSIRSGSSEAAGPLCKGALGKEGHLRCHTI